VKKKYSRLAKWAGIFTTIVTTLTFGILALTQLYNWFGPVSLPECDDSGVQSTIRNIFREKAKVEIAVMDAFTPAPIAADGLSCTADLTFSDKARARLSYRVYLQDGHVMVQTGDVKTL
jgi:hypothetical protein